jgi:hypothetical protein
MVTTVQSFIDELTLQHRVVILGGVAVIAHGYTRHTYDADIWLDPLDDVIAWSTFLEKTCLAFGGLTLHRLPGWTPVSGTELVKAVEETQLVRILGLDCPLDIFRKPNEFELTDFDAVIARSSLNGDGTYLPDPLDLIQSKLDTGRDKDFYDIQYLESVVRSDYTRRLATATLEEAQRMLERFSEWQVLLVALENPCDQVQALARSHLEEFAAAGDPFSAAILAGRELP